MGCGIEDAGVFKFAGLTDLVHCWIVWDQGQQSIVGVVFGLMADKVLVTFVTITLATKGVLFGKCLYAILLLLE